MDSLSLDDWAEEASLLERELSFSADLLRGSEEDLDEDEYDELDFLDLFDFSDELFEEVEFVPLDTALSTLLGRLKPILFI